jgi:tripartite-type tricarboxylate transporter receptor subunit TctC
MNQLGLGVAIAVRDAGSAITRLRPIVTASWHHRIGLAAIITAMLAGIAAAPASAQTNSGRPIRIVVPFAPAGSSDVLARVLQPALQQALGQTVIIENRAGAGSNLGTVEVARAAPDGATFLITSSAFLVNPALYKNVPTTSPRISCLSRSFRSRPIFLPSAPGIPQSTHSPISSRAQRPRRKS